jgi:hypothetical protein
LVQRLEARFQEEMQRKQNEPETKVYGGNQLVMADVHQTEEDLNNDALWGYEPGTTTAWRMAKKARNAEYVAAIAGKTQEAIEKGYSVEDAWYGARGYAVPSQMALPSSSPARAQKVETDKQREAREAREARGGARAWNRYYKANAKYRNPSYQAGQQVGQGIGLDRQVSRNTRKSIA